MPDDTGGFERIGPPGSLVREEGTKTDTGGFERIGPPQPKAGTVLYGLPSLLPESVQRLLPSFVSGPSVGEQLASERQRTVFEEQRLGRPLTLRERLQTEPVLESPVAMGFATHNLADAITTGSVAAAEKAVTNLYQTAVKPSIVGKGTASQVERHNAQARDAISSIVENKPNLSFENGAVTGELPKSLQQFSEAIEQTKGRIFQQYDAMAREAGDRGAIVPLQPIVDELRQLASDQTVKDLHPETATYATARAATLAGRGAYGVAEAQEAVQRLNQSLTGFYKAPSYESASRASVDALIANKLRKGLDVAITNANAPGYQALRQQYSALKQIEDGVTKAASRQARKELGGGLLGTIVNSISATELVHGFFTANPVAIAKALAIPAVARYLASLRSPNLAVEKAFQTAEKMQAPMPVAPNRPISPVLPQQQQNQSTP
jgi:hypothetical protein